MLVPLNFPVYTFKYRNEKQRKYIFDVVRNKFILLTPEEWVRQHVIHYLSSEMNMSWKRMKVEKKVVFNDLTLRLDLAYYNTELKLECLVECKAPTIAINKETLLQAARYCEIIKPTYLFLTNGLTHYWLAYDNNKLVAIDQSKVNL